MKNLTLEPKQLDNLKTGLRIARDITPSAEIKKIYHSLILDVEYQIAEIDESDPQQVWNELKKEIERVTEVWKDKIGQTIDLIDDYHASSKVSYLID